MCGGLLLTGPNALGPRHGAAEFALLASISKWKVGTFSTSRPGRAATFVQKRMGRFARDDLLKADLLYELAALAQPTAAFGPAAKLLLRVHRPRPEEGRWTSAPWSLRSRQVDSEAGDGPESPGVPGGPLMDVEIDRLGECMSLCHRPAQSLLATKCTDVGLRCRQAQQVDMEETFGPVGLGDTRAVLPKGSRSEDARHRDHGREAERGTDGTMRPQPLAAQCERWLQAPPLGAMSSGSMP